MMLTNLKTSCERLLSITALTSMHFQVAKEVLQKRRQKKSLRPRGIPLSRKGSVGEKRKVDMEKRADYWGVKSALVCGDNLSISLDQWA